ncbi:MAG: thioredoxin family protein [Solobacterium sp.]|nr:thioredoxin family protein [Solobacterium sp.]
MKKVKLIFLLVSSVLLAACRNDTAALPLPEVSDGMRGELGIDRNINEETIDKYLNREDSVYRDMRMFVDEADYAAIGGDSVLSGYVKGFEVVPYPYLCNVEGLPEAVGESYTGTTLFTHTADGQYTANYKESMHILETLFPKDKNIFLMCGGGGYAGMTKNLLVALGWDGNRIWNTGGYWYYEGANKVETKYEENGKTYYDFSGAVYHLIDFSVLTPANETAPKPEPTAAAAAESKIKELSGPDELQKLMDEKKTFGVLLYLPGCSGCAAFRPIVEEYAETGMVDIYSANLAAFMEGDNTISENISYAPSMIIYKDGETAAYLDPEKNEDIAYYKNLEGLSSWFGQYLGTDTVTSDTVNDAAECEEGCEVFR